MDSRIIQQQPQQRYSFDSKKFLTNKWRVIGLALFCSVLWGSAFPVLKVSYLEMGIGADDVMAKLLLAGLRFFLASMILFALLAFGFKSNFKVEKQRVKDLVLLGLIQTTLQYFFFYTGLGNTTGIRGSVLTAMGTFFMVIFGHLLYNNDKINFAKTVGLITGFAGIIFMNWGRGGLTGAFVFKGDGYLIFASLMNASGMMIAKGLTNKINPFLVTAWQMLVGSIFLILWGYSGIDGGMNFTPLALGLLIYSAFLSAIAFSLWYGLLKYNKAGEISLYKFMVPIAGAFLSALFIPGEKLSLHMIGALVLVSVGVIAVNYDKKLEDGKVKLSSK